MKSSNIISGLTPESKKIFNLILYNQALTKGTLSGLSGLKLTSLNRAMLPLEKAGLVVKSQIGESTGGRKPVLYDVNPSGYYILGIDISRIYTQAVLVNLKMQIMEKYRFDMDGSSSPEATLNLVWNWIDNVADKLRKSNETLLGTGIGAVGPLDRSSGILLNPENFEAEGWENVPLKSRFEEKLGIPAVIDNGANAAVLAETRYGIARGIKNVIYINCGIGIRTGVFSSGVFVRNINDAEDAFAHMVIDVNGEKCSCGNRGCIEAYSSLYSIIENYMELKDKAAGGPKHPEQVSYRDICAAAEAGDPIAVQVIKDSAAVMGNGIANLIKLLNPGMVILSGPLIQNSGLFYQVCVDTALDKIHMHDTGKIFFSRGGYFDENVISIGSAAMVLEKFLDNVD